MALLSLIPFGCIFFLFVIVFSRPGYGSIYTKARIALLYSILIVCMYCAVITEVLSAFRIIRFSTIALSWTIPFVLLAVYTLQKKLLAKNKEFFIPASKFLMRQPVFWLIAFLFGTSLSVAIMYPINNYDSLTYHMARVEHWEQQQSVSHYQTHILRQLILQPFGEWTILHFRILTGTDRLANAVQLFFLAACLVNVSLITKMLGGNLRHQVLSMLLTCTIPMVVIESNTTQNDIVVSFFILAFVYFTLRVMRQFTTHNLVWAGMTLGLAWLTKGTAYIFTFLFIAWYGMLLLAWYREPLKRILKRALLLSIVPALAILINSTHFYRNIFLTGTPLGNASASTGNEGFQIKSLALVGYKNFLNHMPVTKGFKETVSEQAASWGIDADDPKYNYNTMQWMATGFSFHEDYAQNFPHAVLILLTSIHFLFRRRLYEKPPSLYTFFFFTVVATGLLFTILLKWQPWSNRLQCPLFMLFSVFLAIEIGNWRKLFQYIALVPTVSYGIIALLLSDSHPLLPTSHNIFSKSYTYFMWSDEALECRDYLDKLPYTRLGIYIGADSKDYYYYKLLRKSASGKKRELKHVFVSNGSEIYLDDFVPEAIIYQAGGPSEFTYQGKIFRRIETFREKISVYAPK